MMNAFGSSGENECLEFRNSENDVRKCETILLSQDVVVSGYSYSKLI